MWVYDVVSDIIKFLGTVIQLDLNLYLIPPTDTVEEILQKQVVE